jgi:photosystem I subunit 6
VETRARGAIGTDSERGARARRRDEGLTARAVVRERRSAMKTNAKYGDESVYFDLSDVEATTGSWDVYGVDASSRYPDQQAAFFEYAAQGLGRREAVYSLLAVSAGLLTVGYGVKGAKDAKLPITVGPQQPAVVGPRDRI